LHKAAKYATHFRAQAKVQQSTKQYANCPTNPHPRLSAGRKMASRRLSGQEILFSVFGAIPSAACVKRLLSDLSPVYTVNYTTSRRKRETESEMVQAAN